MKVTDAWMLAAVPACLVACATAPEHPREVVDVPLAAAPGNLGEVGTASLARRGDETSVVITISGVSPPVTRPLRLYAFIYPGTCGKLTATPVVSMNRTRRSHDRKRAVEATPGCADPLREPAVRRLCPRRPQRALGWQRGSILRQPEGRAGVVARVRNRQQAPPG